MGPWRQRAGAARCGRRWGGRSSAPRTWARLYSFPRGLARRRAGAGRSTLVKLLCRLYQPSEGRILVDGVDLARIPADEWRLRLAGAFQDFFRFEFRARHTVGIGDVPRLEDEPAVVSAVDRAGA